MYKELAELLYKYEIDKKKQDEEFIHTSIDIISNNLNVSDYISKIIIDKKDTYYLGQYNLENMELHVNPNLSMLKKQTTFRRNAEMINTLFHELDHASLKKEFETGSLEIIHKLYYYSGVSFREKLKSLEDPKLSDLKDVIIHIFVYYLNHNMVPFERRANLNANHNTREVFSELLKEHSEIDGLIDTLLLSAKSYDALVLYKYKYGFSGVTNSPSYDYCNKYKKILGYVPDFVEDYNKSKKNQFEIDSSDYDLGKRVLYGLQLTNEELKEIKRNSVHKELKKVLKQNHLTKK